MDKLEIAANLVAAGPVKRNLAMSSAATGSFFFLPQIAYGSGGGGGGSNDRNTTTVSRTPGQTVNRDSKTNFGPNKPNSNKSDCTTYNASARIGNNVVGGEASISRTICK